ncbi:carbamoyltransferase, partial [Alphaproteobacteria bacterium]|nr:carbamoyltransferase [Alphaproteobacteria bacterium]
LSEYLSFYLEKFYKNKKINLCLSGGCAANVKLNFELSKLSQIKSLYVSPEMSDGGNALGGAINCFEKFTSLQWLEMQTVYLGPEYSEEQIADSLSKAKISLKKLIGNDKLEFVADELANGKIVGWFQGRMEYGPRALGARSILATPSDSNINDTLNQRLNRTEFMPFAPVTNTKLAEQSFISWKKSDQAARFMTTCYECTDLFRNKCPATVHVDNTARPQVISEEHNPEYFNLIKLFHQKTGIPALINTSFNHHEEPIVCSPDDAISSFLKGNVDILVIGDFIVTSSE